MREIILSFTFVFFAALPGRTTFILLLLSTTTSHWRILLASVPAFTLQCAVAVLAGRALKTVPHRYVEFAAGLLFLHFAGKFWLESRKNNVESPTHSERSLFSIFLIFFLAELGDVSQLAVATRAAQTNQVGAVFLGASVAMALIAFVAVFAGRFMTKYSKPRRLQQLAATIFLGLGVYLLITTFYV